MGYSLLPPAASFPHTAAKFGLPQGAATLFSRRMIDARGRPTDKPDLLWRAGPAEDSKPNIMDSEECLWTQFLSLEVHPRADYVLTGYHSGRGQASFGGSRYYKVDAVVSEDVGGKRRIVVANFDSVVYHRSGIHDRSCRLFHDAQVWGDGPAVAFGRNSDGDGNTEVRQKAYADCLTRAAAAAGYNLSVEYEIHSECTYFHAESVTAKSGRSYSSLRELLLAEHREEAVVGMGSRKVFSQDSLVEMVRNLKPDDDFFGFVVILGGRESKTENFPEEIFGFCHQRRCVSPEEIGQFTEDRVLRMCDGNEEEAAIFLEKKAQQPQTMTTRSFHGGGETISLSYLQFLINERGLTDFVIAHLVVYRRKDFLLPFLERTLQSRHDLQKVPGSELARNTKKLILNS